MTSQTPAAVGVRDWRPLTFVALIAILATLPVWVPTFPPMTDLPQHASQIALLRNMSVADFPFHDDFTVTWFTPYLVGYLFVYSMVPLIGILAACKTVVAVALIALPLTTALLLSETDGEPRWALLTIPASYGFAYQWGFLNFLIAIPIGLMLLWLILRQTSAGASATGAVGVVLATYLLYFSHAMACVFFVAIAGGIVLTRSATWRTAVRQISLLASVVPLMALWTLMTPAHPAGQDVALSLQLDLGWFRTMDGYYTVLADWTARDGFGWGRVTGFFPRLLGMRPGWLPVCLGLALLTLPLAAGSRFRKDRAAWIPFVTCLLTLMFAPNWLFGTAFTYERFALLLMPFLVMTIAPTVRSPRWIWPVAVVLVAVSSGHAIVNVVKYRPDEMQFKRILDRMEPRSRALTFTFEWDSAGFIAPPFLHFPAWYSALKQGVVDPSAAGALATPVQYRAGRQPVVRVVGFEWHPEQFEWTEYHGNSYRYFVVRSASDRSDQLFGSAPCRPRLVERADRWWLYEKDVACERR